jgi:hypothetical protein
MPTPTFEFGSTASPAPRALKFDSLLAAMFMAWPTPDWIVRPPVTEALTLSVIATTPTAAAMLTFPPPCVPWLVCESWLFFSVFELVDLSACCWFWL